MEKKFHLYQSELRSKNISKYKLIGIVTEILLSKKIFPKNEEVSNFLNSAFSITYKDYVIKSRTTIVARCIRDIYGVDEKVFDLYRRKLLEFVKTDIEVKHSSKSSDSLHKWMDGINE